MSDDIEKAARKAANTINRNQFSGLLEDFLAALIREQVDKALIGKIDEYNAMVSPRIAALEAEISVCRSACDEMKGAMIRVSNENVALEAALEKADGLSGAAWIEYERNHNLTRLADNRADYEVARARTKEQKP